MKAVLSGAFFGEGEKSDKSKKSLAFFLCLLSVLVVPVLSVPILQYSSHVWITEQSVKLSLEGIMASDVAPRPVWSGYHELSR